MSVLGHLLRHVPVRQVLEHVPGHMLEHVPAQMLEHVPAQMLEHVLGNVLGLIFLSREKKIPEFFKNV